MKLTHEIPFFSYYKRCWFVVSSDARNNCYMMYEMFGMPINLLHNPTNGMHLHFKWEFRKHIHTLMSTNFMLAHPRDFS